MKSQWTIGIFILIVISLVLFAFNYQGRQKTVPLSEIFPEEKVASVSDKIEYEFVNETEDQPKSDLIAESTDTAVSADKAKEAPIAPAPVSAKASTTAATQAKAVAAAKTLPSAESTAPEASAKNGHGKFTIQIASHNTKESAQLALKNIQAAGYPAFIEKSQVKSKGPHYRIYIGEFQTQDQASNYLANVKKTYKDSFVIAPKWSANTTD